VITEACPIPAPEGIRLSTRFGEFEADGRSLLVFPSGLPGFEGCRRFVVLTSMESAPLQCLMAVDGPPAAFLALDPRLVLPEYRCVLSPGDRLRLGVDDSSQLLWLTLLTLDARGSAYANLRAPVVINPSRMVGFQVVPQDSLYPLRHPVALG
jgi:flagellar assembly factor FliW